ncbi:MAG TPA: BTAD domain-containing putative transcriptional regulator, partial [Paracoccaceae bacterium]|nr:BTAD domain-containing putative transcriptional regulator [Paracoccaceae bacterium]
MLVPATDARLILRLLGGLEVRLDGRPLAFPTRHCALLLAFLAAEPDREVSRARLATLFWGNRGEAQARGSLRQTLYRLNALLEPLQPSPIQANAQAVRLDRSRLWCDVTAFDAGEDIAVYGGEFLDGWGGSDPAFEEWLSAHRAALRRRAAGLFRARAEAASAAGDYARAVEAAERLVALEPFDEEAARCLMAALGRAGQPATARAAFLRLETALRDELGVEPSPESQALARAIAAREGGFAPASAPASAPVAPLPATSADELRQVTVLAIAADLADGDPDPEAIAEGGALLGRALTELLARYEVEPEPVAGLTFLARFGLPHAHDLVAESAARAALAVQAACADLPGLGPARIGIATGPILLGSGSRAMLGAAPDRALRLSARARPGEALVAAETLELLGGLFETSPAPGPAGEAAHSLGPEQSGKSRFAARHPTDPGPMVGRDAELA